LLEHKEFVIKKIQGIRGCFRKELRKTKKTLKSGCGEEDMHKPSLWYFDLLLFTKDQEEPTANTSNIESNIEENNSEHTRESELLEEPDRSQDQEKETVSTVIVIIFSVIQHPFLQFHIAMVPCDHY
jgi:hypothetical protein